MSAAVFSLNALIAIGLGIVGLALLVMVGIGVTSAVCWVMREEEE